MKRNQRDNNGRALKHYGQPKKLGKIHLIACIGFIVREDWQRAFEVDIKFPQGVYSMTEEDL